MEVCALECRYPLGPEASDPLRAGEQAVVRQLIRVLGTKIRSSARAVHAQSHSAISPLPLVIVFISTAFSLPFINMILPLSLIPLLVEIKK